MEKQVIVNKREYDSMESELKDLRAIVKSRTISVIISPRYGWLASMPDAHTIEYIAGLDENQAINGLVEEIKRLESTNESYMATIQTMSRDIKSQDDWKKLPWYKRLFKL